MKTLILAILILSSFKSFAATDEARDLGTREDAYKICQQLPFQSDRNECIQKLRRYRYFDDRALEICSSLTFAREKVDCIWVIGDKEYENYEINNCIGQTFPSDRVKCLRESGGPLHSGACTDKRLALAYLQGARTDLGQGNLNEVGAKLDYLINVFEACR
jgi:hypothetical protein